MALVWPLQMPSTAKAVLISLADQANDAGVCWPSLPGICDRTCFGRTAVIEAVKWLTAEGYLSVSQAHGRTNTYTLNLEAIGGAVVHTRPPAGPVRQPDQSANRTPGSPLAGPLPSASRTTPVRQPDPNRKEPSLNRQLNRQDPAASLPGFDRFWVAWPKGGRKGGEGKCLERWKSKNFEAQADAIVAHVEAMTASHDWTKDGGQFRPAPLTYLNQTRWDGADIEAIHRACDDASQRASTSRHTGFAQKNYREGINEDGSFD
jgi:hypothetical protein